VSQMQKTMLILSVLDSINSQTCNKRRKLRKNKSRRAAF
jgi:hypothetical protein